MWTDGLCMHGSQLEAWRRRCVGVGDYHLFSNKTMTTPLGCVRDIWQRSTVMECCIRRPGRHSHLTRTQVWDETDHKATGPMCTPHQTPSRLLENLFRWPDSHPENTKSVWSRNQSKGWLFWKISNLKHVLSYFTLGYCLVPHVFINSFDALSENLQWKKNHKI